MSVSKIVKRYANRKLYDTERSCYVTLDDIAAMVKDGEMVKVVDNRTGQDLTSVTLAQIVFELEKRNNFMPLDVLRSLIRDGQANTLRAANDSATQPQTQAQGSVEVNDLVGDKDLAKQAVNENAE